MTTIKDIHPHVSDKHAVLCTSEILPGLSSTSKQLVHPHQRCGYSDSPFARRDTFLYCRIQKGHILFHTAGSRKDTYFSILQGLEMSWRGWASGGNDTKRKLYLRKRHLFVMEKYIEDAKQK